MSGQEKKGKKDCIVFLCTCIICQGGDGALLWEHALHSACLFGMVEPEEVGITETQGIT